MNLFQKDTMGNSGLPWGLSGKESACQRKRLRLDPWVRSPLEEEMAIHSSVLAWETPQTKKPRWQ